MKGLEILEWGTSHFDDFLSEGSDKELEEFLVASLKAIGLVNHELKRRAFKKGSVDPGIEKRLQN